jgi:hypothetical protein
MFGLGLTGWLICLIVAGAIANSKNRNALGWAFITGLLPVVGLIIVAVLPALPPPAPIGMRSVRCPRCNALQNIPATDPTFECWQCKLVSEAAGAHVDTPRRPPDDPEDLRDWLNRVKDK